MATLKDEIRKLLGAAPGLTDREITDRLRGAKTRHQPTTVVCRGMVRTGELERRKRDDGLTGNHPLGDGTDARSGIGADQLSEDDVKRALARWLRNEGWASSVAWGQKQGIDVEGTRGDERWVIEAKGCGSSEQMRGNYFKMVLGDALRRMDDPEARYSIALPDMRQYRGLWDRLPALAKRRMRTSALFVDDVEGVRKEAEDTSRGKPSSRCYVPSGGPLGWRDFLADPDKQWKTGYSAKALAESWEAQNGLPEAVGSLIKSVPRYAEKNLELLVALPEWEVPLPGGSEGSHNDVLALIGVGDDLMVAAVEGKVSEPFDRTIDEWFSKPSDGKRKRLEYLCGLLGMAFPPLGHLRYQLFHRAASAVIERGRFRAQAAVMVVHSFSGEKAGFDDYKAFVNELGGSAEPDRMTEVGLPDGTTLLLGWASGEEAAPTT